MLPSQGYSRKSEKQSIKGIYNPVCYRWDTITLKNCMLNLKGHYRHFGVVGDILPYTSHKKVVESLSAVGRQPYDIGIPTFTKFQNSVLHAITVIDLYFQTYFGLVQKLIDLPKGILGTQKSFSRSIYIDQDHFCR